MLAGVSSEPPGFFPLILYFGSVMLALSAGFGALMFWGIIRKSGGRGWHSLVPVLQWTEAAKAAGRSPRWGFAVGVFPILYSATVSVLISAMPTEPRFESPSALMLVFLVVLWMMEMLAIVGHIYIAIGIRRTFDTSDALLVAMIIVPFVGYAVVGFGATTHRPPPIDPDEQTPTATGS